MTDTQRPEIADPGDVAESTWFTDKAGRSWDVELTLGSAKEIDQSDYRELTDKAFSFIDPDRDFFMELMTNHALVFALVWTVVRHQATQYEEFKGLDVNGEEAQTVFMRGMNGQAIEDGRRAFWKAISDFFPSLRSVLLTLLARFEASQKTIGDGIAKMSGKIQEAMDREIREGLQDLEQELQDYAGNRGKGSTLQPGR